MNNTNSHTKIFNSVIHKKTQIFPNLVNIRIPDFSHLVNIYAELSISKLYSLITYAFAFEWCQHSI